MRAQRPERPGEAVVIHGTVRDSLTRGPVPFAILRITETDSSTITDQQGRFRLQLEPGVWQLEVRRIGYRMASATLRARTSATPLDVFMHPIPVDLEAITVRSKDDFASRVVRAAIERKNDVLSRIQNYRYDAYVKFIVRDMEKDEDSTDAVVLITETQTTAYWEQPNRYQEVITARRQSSNLNAERNLISVGQIVNFNRNRIDLQKYSVVSPTADDALDHYRYVVIDTLVLDGRRTFRLAIEPKSTSEPLFVGMMDIADSTYDVLSIDVGANQAIRFDFFKNLRYQQRLSDLGDDRWMPRQIRFSGEVHIGIPIPGFPEHLTARRQSSNLNAERNLISVGQIVNFNRNRIDLQKYSVVSPTADDALDHYRYVVIDTLVLDGRRTFRLAIEPKSTSEPLFVGMMDIADSTYDVLSIDVGANQAIRFDFFKNLRYQQRLSDLGDDRWMPRQIRFSGEVHIGIPIPGFPEHLTFEHVASLADFRFDRGNAPATLGEFLIIVDDAADESDSTAWEGRRPAPLTTVEQGAWTRIDSIQSQPPSLTRRLIGGTAGIVLLANNHDFFHYSRTEGVFLGAAMTRRDLTPDFVFHAELGHAFAADRWQYRLVAQYRLSERQRLWLGGSYHDEIVSRPTVLSVGLNPTFSSLIFRRDPLDYYRDRGFTISLSTKLLDFITLQILYNDRDQTSVPVVTQYSILDVDRLQRENPPIVDGRLRSVSVAFTFDSRPLLKRKRRDYYLQSLTQTRLTVGAEFASPGFIANDFRFARYFVRLHRRQRTLNLGLTTIDGYAGTATSGLPPQRYFNVDYGRGSRFFEPGNFTTLSETNFIGNRVALLTVAHDFDQLLFRQSGVPGFRDIPVTLSIHGGAFWTDFVHHQLNPGDVLLQTAPTAYTELGFGIGNLTPFIAPLNLGLYFTWQLSSYGTTKFELRFAGPGI